MTHVVEPPQASPDREPVPESASPPPDLAPTATVADLATTAIDATGAEPSAVRIDAEAVATPAQPAAQSVPVESGAVRPRSGSRRRQIAGTIGILVSVALIVATLVARAFVADRVTQTTDRIDVRLAAAAPLLEAIDTTADNARARVQTVADAASSYATNPNSPGLLQILLTDLTDLEERYRSFRSAYTEFRTAAASAIERLQSVDSLVPGVSLSTASAQLLDALDARIASLDARFTELMNAKPADLLVSGAATVIAEKAGQLEQGLATIGAVVDRTSNGLARVRTEVSDLNDTIILGVTLVALALAGWLAYTALLNVVLIRDGRALARAARPQSA